MRPFAFLCSLIGHKFEKWRAVGVAPHAFKRECARCPVTEVQDAAGKTSRLNGPVVFIDRDALDRGVRVRLPNRHQSIRTSITWQDARGEPHQCQVSFGFDAQGAIREVFCIAHKDGTDLQALVHDACIATSHALQRGARIADLAKSFGELRNEGEESGLAASPIGSLARVGAALEIELRGTNASA
jgi:hypothetical protein